MRSRTYISGASLSRYVFPLGLSLLVACTTTVEPRAVSVRIEAVNPSIRPGDELRFIIHNLRARTIGYNVCGSQLERWTGSTWVSAEPNEEGPNCAAVLLTLKPHQSSAILGVVLHNASASGIVPTSLTPGTYRIVIPMLIDVESGSPLPVADRASSPFTIE